MKAAHLAAHSNELKVNSTVITVLIVFYACDDSPALLADGPGNTMDHLRFLEQLVCDAQLPW